MRRPRLHFPRWLRLARRWLALSGFVAAATTARAQRAPVPPVQPLDRAQVCAWYRLYYQPAARTAPGWTGSVADGVPGKVSPEFLRATLRRINYFRAMSGLPGDVTFDLANNARCQQAALMMAAERVVSHSPSRFWKFYSRDAALAASHSDLDLDWHGDLGPAAIDRYMDDFGAHNASVGHRRWLLSPGTTRMGAGIVPANGSLHPGVNVTWIMDVASGSGEVPADPPAAPPGDPAVCWPPCGFVPAPLVYPRWSFALPRADFHRARVRVVKDGRPLPVKLERLAYQGDADGSGRTLGANTLVWTLPGNVVNRAADESYRVQLADVLVEGQPREFTYAVTSIDPARPGRPAAAVEGTRLAVEGPAAGRR